MKLAYLANIRYPSDRAHAAQITHMCQAFASKQADVTLFVNSCQTAESNDVQKVFAINPNFTVRQLPPRFFFGAGKIGFFIRELLFVCSFYRGYKNESYDMLYCRNEFTLFFLSFLLPVKHMVYESHEANYNRAVRHLIAKGVPVIVISQGIYDFYISQGVSPEQLLVADDGIDESFFDQAPSQATVRNRLGLGQDDFIAMYIGGFADWKGIDTFLEAAEHSSDVTYVAVGGSEQEVLVKKEKYPAVTFLGALPYKDLRDNQQAADVLVIPNTATTPLSSLYTSPLKLFAHMTSGVPLVASDIPSLTSVLFESDATLVKPDNAASLAKGVDLVQQESESKVAAARLLRERSRSFTWTNRSQNILTFVQQYNEKNNQTIIASFLGKSCQFRKGT